MKRDSKIQSHPLQSTAWADFRRAMGVDVVELDNWVITFHKIPYTPWTIGYFPKGPMPDRQLLEELTRLGKSKKAIFIQIEPNVLHNLAFSIQHLAFLRPSHHPLFTKYTFVLDLSKTEDELLAGMHPKTRYNIRLAQKHGVKIQEDNSGKAFQEYLTLSEETTSRQGFYAHDKTYHKIMWANLRKADIAHLFTATYQSQILAAWIVFVWNDTIYYPYGTSSRAHREVMAPYLLLWEIARWAKTKKLHFFDLWGAIGPNPNPKDPWFGFHRFKQGFNPKLVEFVGSYDLVINPSLYRFYTIADALRWTLLRAKNCLSNMKR